MFRSANPSHTSTSAIVIEVKLSVDGDSDAATGKITPILMYELEY